MRSTPEALTVLRTGLPVSSPPADDALASARLHGTGLRDVVPVAALRSRLVSSQEVHLVSHRLQVAGPHAPSVAAQVIEIEPVRDRTHQEGVDDPVCQGATESDALELPVPVGVEASGPAPASTTNTERLRPALVHQAQHVGRRRRGVSAPLVEHPPVVALAHPSAQSPRATFIIVNRASHGAYPTLPTGGTR